MYTSSLKKAVGLAALVTQLTLMVVGGLLAGKWLDQRFGVEPIGLMSGVFVGFGLGMYRLARMVSLMDEGSRHDTDA